jgi:mono/diheme cytochrome c family protein
MANRNLLFIAVVGPVASLTACQTTPVSSAPAQTALDTRAPAFIEAACAGCHAVEPPFLSPNPRAPSFAAIANRPELTGDTIGTWLTDAHNYPEVMDFDLEPAQIDLIAEYMITLRREDYRPEQ